MKKPFSLDFSFSPADVAAVLASLPLTSYVPTNAAVRHANAVLCESAAEKLSSGSSAITPNEFRMVALSVAIARDVLSGSPDWEVSEEDRRAISPHFFTLNRLAAQFDPILDRLLYT